MKFNGHIVALVLSFLAPRATASSSSSRHKTRMQLSNNINDLLYRGTDRFTTGLANSRKNDDGEVTAEKYKGLLF